MVICILHNGKLNNSIGKDYILINRISYLTFDIWPAWDKNDNTNHLQFKSRPVLGAILSHMQCTWMTTQSASVKGNEFASICLQGR